MIYSAEPAILILSGQGRGGGVEHRPIRLAAAGGGDRSNEANYPRSNDVADWASLNTELVPKDSNELILVISRHSDQNGVPWTYVAEYAKANLTGQERGNHYSGVGLAVRAASVPEQAAAMIHAIHAAMITDILPQREFKRPISEWQPPDILLAALAELPYSPLRPGFGGIQPGKSLARLVYSSSVDGFMRDAQSSSSYRHLSALIVSSLGSGKSREVYVRNERGIEPWVEENSPSPATRAAAISTHKEVQYTAETPITVTTDVVRSLKNQIKALEAQVKILVSDRDNLKNNPIQRDSTRRERSSALVLWAIFASLAYLGVIATIATFSNSIKTDKTVAIDTIDQNALDNDIGITPGENDYAANQAAGNAADNQ